LTMRVWVLLVLSL